MKFQNYNTQRGNVLFLILIAVALFAALSYAVTQSTRSGSGSTERETSILSGAAMTQYPAGLRTSIVRMVLGGVDITQLEFDAPGNIETGNERFSVFHPSGGGAVFQNAPADLMENATAGRWYYNANFDVPDIGLSDTSDGNDLIAFLPGVSRNVCLAVNNEVTFVEDIADCTSTDGVTPDVDVSITETNITQNIQVFNEASINTDFPTGNQEDLVNASSNCSAFNAQPAGCFYAADLGSGTYVYYSVLLER